MNRFFLPIVAVSAIQAQILVDTVAGGKIRSGVPAQDVALGTTISIAWDPAGNLAFVDSAHDVIRRVGADGNVETIAGTGVSGNAGDGGPVTNALLHGPQSLKYDAAGNLYFYDSMNARIRRVDAHGVIATIAGDGIPYSVGMDLEGPALLRSISVTDIAVDATGVVYFSDVNSGVIRRVTKNGQLEIVAGVNDPGCSNCSDGDGGPAKAAHLNRPRFLVLDSSGNLYVVELSYDNVIRRISPDGIITKFAGYGPFPANQLPRDGGPALAEYFGSIMGLAADGNGNIYVAHERQPLVPRVRRIDSSGVISTVVAGPDGILAASNSGKLALANSTGLFLVATDGTLSPIAGGSPRPAPDGTPAHDAWLLNPGPIAFNHAGELYLAEEQTCVIRKVDANGILRTLAGTGKCGAALPDLAAIRSMAFDSQNRLWVVCGPAIYVIAPDGSITVSTLGAANAIAFDAKDRLYLMNRYSLDRISPDGAKRNIVTLNTGVLFPLPGLTGLGSDPQENVYFESAADGNLYRVNDDGSYAMIYRIDGIQGAAVDATGTAWSEAFWGRMYFTNSSGTFFLGGRDPGYSGDGGPAQSARFSQVTSATFAPNGEMYFVDGDRIRKLIGIQPQTPPVISPGGIVNSASYNGGAISPEEIVSIFGSNFGTSGLVLAPYENNTVPFQLGRTKVLFDDQEGEILAMTPNLINVIVPSNVQVGKNVRVRVQVDATVSSPVTMPVVATMPDLYTMDESGSGPGVIVNEDGSLNGSANPARRGSVVAFYGTGEGVLSPQLPMGALTISTPFPIMTAKPAVTIAGQPAEVRYAGAAPLFPVGVFEIDARIPVTIASGPAPVAVTAGDRSSTRIVTVAVQ